MLCIVCENWGATEDVVDSEFYSDEHGNEFAVIHTRCYCPTCQHTWLKHYNATITDEYETDIKSTITYND